MSTHPQLTIDGLIAELLTLGKISEGEPPVVTRVVFSEADMRGRAFVRGLCEEAGLSIDVEVCRLLGEGVLAVGEGRVEGREEVARGVRRGEVWAGGG